MNTNHIINVYPANGQAWQLQSPNSTSMLGRTLPIYVSPDDASQGALYQLCSSQPSIFALIIPIAILTSSSSTLCARYHDSTAPLARTQHMSPKSAPLNACGKTAGLREFHLEARTRTAWGPVRENTPGAPTSACFPGRSDPDQEVYWV